MGAPFTQFFSFFHLIQVEGFYHLDTWFHLETMILILHDINLVLLNQIILVFHSQVTMGCKRCLKMWIDIDNVLL
jgi:hypothetical protein